MCNVFGDPSAVAHKVEVLQRHCTDVDRDPQEILVTHLINVLVGRDQAGLRQRIHELRGRNQTVEQFADRHNAGTVPDLIDLFNGYEEIGARHSIVALPDVALEDSIETFGEVIAAFE